MRKALLIVSFMIFMLLFSGCSRTASSNLEFSFDNNGDYEGFKTLPSNYTSKQAIKDGCYVIKNLEEVGGGKEWTRFIENAEKGMDSSIRIMSIFHDDTNYDVGTYYQDLFYVDGNYRIFDSTSEDLTDHKFKYILDLKGRFPNAEKDSRFVVLTDDNTLTFEKVSLSIFSSSTEVINSISPFKIVAGMGS